MIAARRTTRRGRVAHDEWVIKRLEVLRAVTAGVLLPLVAGVAALLLFVLLPCSERACVTLLDSAADAALWIAAALGWPLLYLLNVRPAWSVAALGALFMAVIWQFASSGIDVAAGIVAYPVATLLLRNDR